MSLLRDAGAGALVLSLLLLPAWLFLPTLLRPLASTARALLSSFLWLCALVAIGLGALGSALVAEKAYRRWILKEPRRRPLPTRTTAEGARAGDATASSAPTTGTPARLHESRLDAAAEHVIERLEQSRVGRALRRRGGARGATAGTSAAAAGDVELKEMKRGVAGTTAVRRVPPPPPPLPSSAL